MKRFAILLLAFWPLGLGAQDVVTTDNAGVDEVKGSPEFPYSGSEVTLDEFKWRARLIVVFADTDADPAFRLQMDLLNRRPEVLAERETLVIVDTDPAAQSAVRRALRPREFMLVLIDKEGQVELRKPRPWGLREISRVIDKMPLRQLEIEEMLRGR